MAKRELHFKALEMRVKGMSYSQIKAELGISKSTLSGWLSGHPLSEERIRELRNKNHRQIERTRETKARKRAKRLELVQEKVAHDVGELSNREIFLCGLYLYWGEGSKTQITTVSISNTDPSVVLFFKKWVMLLGIPEEKLRVYLHLYTDMDPVAETEYWSEMLKLPLTAFRKPYIKESNRTGLSYTQRFTHGTCNLICHSRDLGEYIHMALERIRSPLIAGSSQI